MVSNIIKEHKAKTDAIINYIASNQGFNVVQINGPAGSGKTILLQSVNEGVNQFEFCTIYLRGEQLRHSEPFYPLSVFVEKRKKITKTAKDVFVGALEEIPVIGKALKALINGINIPAFANQKKVNEISELKAHISFSLRIIGLLGKYRKVIIFCENFKYFDQFTIDYLLGLEQGIKKIYQECSLSLVLDGASVTSLNSGLLKLKISFQVDCELPKKENLPSLLQQFGLKKPISPSLIDAIYTSTGGNLEVLKLVVEYLNQTSSNSDQLNLDYDIVDSIISLRLSEEVTDKNIEKTLNVIASIGSQVNRNEVLCVLNNNVEIFDILGIAQSMEFIFLKDNYVQFTHESIWKVFSKRATTTKLSTYSKLSECLAKITPYNYVRRALVEEINNNHERADLLWTLAAIQKFRHGSFEEGLELLKKLKSTLADSYQNLLILFCNCYRTSFEGKATKALDLISDIPNTIPRLLHAEKTCIECENLSKLIDISAKKKMLILLEGWGDIQLEDPYTWYRLIQLKILACNELQMEELVISSEKEVVSFFSKRVEYDLISIDVLNRLDQYAELIYSPEVSHKKLLRVEQNLTVALDNEQFDKIIDLFIVKINLSSNSLLLGKYEKAITVALSGLKLIETMPKIHFPNTEVLLSNLYLAALFNNTISIDETQKKYSRLLIDFENEEDYVLLRINYAGLLLLNGKIQESFELLKQLFELTKLRQIDKYYYYYTRFNFYLVSYLVINKNESLQNLEKLDEYVEIACRRSSSLYRKHYDLTLKIMKSKKPNTLIEIKEGFCNELEHYYSSEWNKFKNIYLFSDLQIWTSF